MDTNERKEIVAKLLKEGRRLSEIQDYLHKEKGDSITYMELRMLLAEMEAKLPNESSHTFAPLKPTGVINQPPGPAAAPVKDKLAPAGTAPKPGARGRTTVAVDAAPPPGAVLSGRVNFGSGAKALWLMDDYGRIGLEPELGSGKPDQQDMQEFQVELRRLLEEAERRGGGF